MRLLTALLFVMGCNPTPVRYYVCDYLGNNCTQFASFKNRDGCEEYKLLNSCLINTNELIETGRTEIRTQASKISTGKCQE